MSLERPDRVALVGATSEIGDEVKQLLARAGYPGEVVELLDLDDAVGVLTDYGEEARVVVEAAAEQLRDHRLACFCGDPDTARELAPALVEAGGVAIDCTGTWLFDDQARLVDPLADQGLRVAEEPEILTVPGAAALLLIAMENLLGIAAQRGVATLLLPASEGGETGPQQLAREATTLLSFGDDQAEEMFGRRLAFDVWPEHASTGARSSTLGVVDQLRRLDRPAPALSTLRASTFHGLAVSVYLPDAEADEVRETIEAAGLAIGVEGEAGTVDSPARVVGLRGLHVGDVWADAGNGAWIWAMVDNHDAVGAAAVTAIAAHLQPPDTDTIN